MVIKRTVPIIFLAPGSPKLRTTVALRGIYPCSTNSSLISIHVTRYRATEKNLFLIPREWLMAYPGGIEEALTNTSRIQVLCCLRHLCHDDLNKEYHRLKELQKNTMDKLDQAIKTIAKQRHDIEELQETLTRLKSQ